MYIEMIVTIPFVDVIRENRTQYPLTSKQRPANIHYRLTITLKGQNQISSHQVAVSCSFACKHTRIATCK